MTVLGQVGVTRGVLHGARFEVGAAANLAAVSDLAASAKTSLVGEMFKLNDDAFVGALRERGGAIPVRLLADTQYMNDPEAFIIGAGDGVEVIGHGDYPTKLHTKTLVADGERGLMMTPAAVGDLRASDTVDFAAHVRGEDARLLERLAISGMSGDGDAIRSAARDAASRGIYVNDPAHGLTLLRDRMELQVARAQHSIYAASKVIDDPESIRMLLAAQDRGLDVVLETATKSWKRDVRAARAAGLDVQVTSGDHSRLHGNFMVTDLNTPGEEAYMGTAMLSLRGMIRGDAARQGRELGWITTDRSGIDSAIDAIANLPGSSVADFARRQGA